MSELNRIEPFFSIVIPTYNRPEQLNECLRSIDGLEYPKTRFEVVIVDDGGELDLEELISPFRDRINLQLVKQENAGPSRARNRGASQAKGAFLAFVDDDCLLSPEWLNEMADEAVQCPDSLLGGKTLNLLQDNLFSSVSQLIIDLVYEHYNVNSQNAFFFASNNMGISKEKFMEIGGFAENWRFSEDRELCDRWIGQGNNMRFVRAAIIHHAHSMGLGGFCCQHFSYGKGAYHFRRVQRMRSSTSFERNLKFHANPVNWLVVPFERKMKRPFALCFLLLTWQVANLIGFLWAACFERKKTEPLVAGFSELA